MSLTIPITFATRTGELQLAYLDDNFTYLKNQLDITNSTATNTNATITNILTQLTVLGSNTSVGDVLYVDDSNNRVGIKRSSPTVELDVNGAVKATSLALTTPLPTTSGGLGATTASGVGGWLDNILPSGEVSGYVLTTTGAGSYQWAAAGSPSGTVGTKIDTTRQTFTATASQTVFTLTSITYTPGSGQLRVYIDGVRQFPSAYTETSSSVFTLSTGVTAGVSVLAEIDGYVSYPIAASDISYTPAGGSSISATNVQSAVSELEVEKAPKDTPVFTGNATFDTNTLYVDATNNKVGIGNTTPYTELDVTGTINGRIPGWTYWIDTTSGSRTTIASFVKNANVVGYMPSYGDVEYWYYNQGWSFMFQMKVYSPTTQAVTQLTGGIDDNIYFFISGGTGSSTVSPASATGSGTVVTWTLTAGVNLLTIIQNNSGGSGAYANLFGEFLLRYPTLKYVAP
jgi:hypothetical protein